MTYETINERNLSAGVGELLLYTADIVPSFIPLTLFSFFIIISMGSYFSKIRLTGSGNFPASLAVASYLTTILAFSLSLIDGLMNITTLVICVTISGFSTLLLLFTKDKN